MVDPRNNIQEARQLLQNALQGFDACETDAQRAEFTKDHIQKLTSLVLVPDANPQDVKSHHLTGLTLMDFYFKQSAIVRKRYQDEVASLEAALKAKISENDEMQKMFGIADDPLINEVESLIVA